MAFSSTLQAEKRWTHYGLRPLAMGNAFVAVANDHNALFYNPAGLARLEEWTEEIVSPEVETNKASMDGIKEIMDFTKSSASSGVSGTLNLIQAQAGRHYHAALSLAPHFVMKHFGFSIATRTNLSMTPHADLSADVDVGTQILVPIGFAGNWLGDRLSLGMSLKPVALIGADRTFSIDDLSVLTSKNTAAIGELLEAGTGVGFDFGMLYTPIKTMEPTFGLSVTDLGGTSYKAASIPTGSKASAPPTRMTSINSGFSIKPLQTASQYLLLAIDNHGMNQPTHYSHKLHLGTEWGFRKIFKIQAGVSDGLISGGFQFDVGLLKLRLITYGIDTSPVIGQIESNVERRYALQLKLLI